MFFYFVRASYMKRRAVVTGATRGIGYAIAARLIDDGLDVLGTGTTPKGTVPSGVEYHQVDFLDPISLDQFLDKMVYLNIAVLVNNAGINKIGKFDEILKNDLNNILDVNLKAPFMLCQQVIPSMKKMHWGRIVNLSSIFSHITKEYRAPYSSSKFGLDGMTAALSAEVSEYNILANCVAPGFIDTDLTRRVLGDDGIADLVKKIPMKRVGDPKEIAAFVSWLVSDENTYITGQNIMIDGGFSRV
jgi:NAD(P)-dependent dehydrogenase (short-subunit alcohol dehydrogenase family)